MAFLETKGMLAKCLATENLIIEHSYDASTASFDTQNRVLTLPVLKTDNENVYNMFVGHEVGHALLTPVEWKNDVPDYVPYDFVNVIEDIRIEKFIQSKFPGLRRDFTKGYQELNDKDFFKLENTDISKLSLIDRINLHYKLGAQAMIPFSEEEQQYVVAAGEADTWQKVCLVAKLLSIYCKAPKQEESEQTPEATDGEGKVETDDDSQGQSSQQNTPPDDSKQEEGDVEQEAESGGDKPDELTSSTQRSFDESMSEITEDNKFSCNKFIYTKINHNIDDAFINIHVLRNSILHGQYSHYHRDKLAEFLDSIRSDVNHMVQQFEMKKSADAYARQQTHKTGVLDTNSLHNYKLVDDIFLRQSVTPDGKNHGMVMYIDWSGSMCSICHDTVKQIITLVQFCRKVQIPFEVYTFTSRSSYDFKDVEDNEIGFLCNNCVQLVNVLTSSAKRSQIDEDMFNLFSASMVISFNSQHLKYTWSPFFNMSGTPLNNVLLMTPQVIDNFKKNTGAQNVSFVCITDGESSPTYYNDKHVNYDGTECGRPKYQYYETVMIRDGSRVFKLSDIGSATHEILVWLNDRMKDVSITNIFLASATASERYLRSFGVTLDTKKFKKNGCDVYKTEYWNNLGVINPKVFTGTTDDIEVDSGASKAKIKSALNKMLKTKQSSRVILTQVVSDFA